MIQKQQTFDSFFHRFSTWKITNLQYSFGRHIRAVGTEMKLCTGTTNKTLFKRKIMSYHDIIL